MQFRYGSGGRVPDQQQARRMNPPDNEIPVGVALNVVLARTDQVAMALVGAQVYSTGVSLGLAVHCRPAVLAGRRHLPELVFAHGDAPSLLLGLELADGRRISNLDQFRGIPAAGELFFHPAGGGGGRLSVEQSWWLSPVPPAGPLQVVVRCEPLGIQETRTVLDAGPLAAAGAGVVELWPWEPPPEMRPREDRPIPPGSWFADGD
jgi:hypothetical protein